MQEAAGIGIWEYSPASGTMYWSPEQFSLYGVPPEQGPPTYREWLDMIEPDDRAAAERAEAGLTAQRVKAIRFEFRIRRLVDGALRWLLSIGRLVTDKTGQPRLVGANFDVTELRQTEAQLRQANTMLRMVQQAVGIGMWELDLAAERGSWSAEQCALFGLAPDQGAPSVPQWLAMLVPEDRAMMRQVLDDLAAGRTDFLNREYAINRAGDGALRWIACMGRVIADPTARGRRLAGVCFDVTDLRQAEAALRRSEALFRATFEQAAVGMAYLHFDGSLIRVNDRLCELLGYPRDELMRLTYRDVTHPDDLHSSEAELQRFLAADDTTYRMDKRYIRKDGTPLWITLTVSKMRDAGGTPLHCMAVIEDLTQRKLAELALQESEARARRLFDGAPLPNYLVDAATTAIVDSNEAATHMLGYSRAELRAMHLADVDPTEHGTQVIPRQLLASDEPMQFETTHRTRGGELRDVVVAVVPVDMPGRRLMHGTVVDISHRKRAEADLKHQAEHDGLTGLASRAWFFNALEAVLHGTVGAGRRNGALILVDIDYFKQVNDTLGHDAGDTLLVEMAARLRARCRPDDVAARLGGDEFALLIPGIRDERAITSRMADILAAMTPPIDIGGRLVHVSVSMGATFFPRDGAGPRDLLKHADLALYEAKRSGRACWRFFRPEQAESMERHVRMADALRDAIRARAIRIALQPKRLLGGGHAGFEALARWHDGTDWVPPGEFIPIAEATGLIRPLGRLVLDLALAQVKALRGKNLDPGRVAVNVSGAELLDADFMHQTQAALRRHRLPPSSLELEVTETVLLGRTADRVETVLRDLRASGISLALDDFGTGFASLAHISRLAVDQLKIDRTFVADIGHGSRADVIARTIISLARDLDIQSVAEGVETAEQLAFLTAEGCNAMQGYLIAPPLATLDEVAAYLRRGARPTSIGQWMPAAQR